MFKNEGKVELVTNRILSIFDRYRKPAVKDIDLYDNIGRDVLKDKVRYFIEMGEPVEFVLPGYPAKSANVRKKVLGDLPDGSEEVSFLHLSEFCRMVENEYEQGVRIHVVSDGYVFNDLVRIPDSTVQKYEEECRSMVHTLPLVWHTVFEFYEDGFSRRDIVDSLLDQFGVSDEELDEHIKTDQDTKILYCGIHRFMQLDILWPTEWSRNRVRNESKPIARQVVARSEAYSKLIKQNFQTQ